MEKKRQIANIICFIRGSEPRNRKLDLIRPVTEQVKLLGRYNLKGTFLYQYDALISSDFTAPMKLCRTPVEIGVWLEIVEPLCRAAGIPWRGRPGFDWDWHAHCGFSVGYTLEERRRLCDVLFEKFRTVFGYYPRVIGSWMIDGYTLGYLYKRYNIIGSCNCKDQWGTDGYTLWGGYYGQAYYPSVNNGFCPAQTPDCQIPVPVFRMLGSDPIYQYDWGLEQSQSLESQELQGVVTLEPVFCGEGGGGDPKWVDWYLKENFAPDTLSFGYTQIGQENSFGWEAMEKGLCYQFSRISEMIKQGYLEAETLAETAFWFKEKYPLTPASTITAFEDWRGMNRKALWYCCRNYRANFLLRGGRVYIRDMFLFDQNYTERYRKEPCRTDYLIFDNLAVMDGNRWSGSNVRAGIYPMWESAPENSYTEVLSRHENTAENEISFYVSSVCGNYRVTCSEEQLIFKSDRPGLFLEFRQKADSPHAEINGRQLYFSQNGFAYSVTVSKGILKNSDSGIQISAEDNEICFHFFLYPSV